MATFWDESLGAVLANRRPIFPPVRVGPHNLLSSSQYNTLRPNSPWPVRGF